jgi:hypothetical protein
VSIAASLVHAGAWDGPFFCLFQRAYPRIAPVLRPADVRSLVTVGLALEHLSPFPRFAVPLRLQTEGDSGIGGGSGMGVMAAAAGDGSSSDGARTSSRGGAGPAATLAGATVAVVDPTGFPMRCALPPPSAAASQLARFLPRAWARVKASASPDGPPDRKPLPRLATHFVTPEGLVLDAALPDARVGVRVVSKWHYNPRRSGMLPAFLTEQLLLESGGWTVLHTRAFEGGGGGGGGGAASGQGGAAGAAATAAANAAAAARAGRLARGLYTAYQRQVAALAQRQPSSSDAAPGAQVIVTQASPAASADELPGAALESAAAVAAVPAAAASGTWQHPEELGDSDAHSTAIGARTGAVTHDDDGSGDVADRGASAEPRSAVMLQ